MIRPRHFRCDQIAQIVLPYDDPDKGHVRDAPASWMSQLQSRPRRTFCVFMQPPPHVATIARRVPSVCAYSSSTTVPLTFLQR